MKHLIEIIPFSEYLVNYFNYFQEPITNKKLQKLLYYIQGWHLAYFENQLFDESPEAWVHGPVYPSVYQRYKGFRFSPVATNAESIDLAYLNKALSSFEFSKDQIDFLDSVIKHYGGKSAFELEMRSHNELPWMEARTNLSDIDISQNPIHIGTMQKYFTSRIPEPNKV